MNLDNELLKGGVMLSEWCSFIVQEADAAYLACADLAAILTATATIETYLRSEIPTGSAKSLAHLVDSSGLDEDLRVMLHEIRLFRNQWVHVADPWDDQELQISPDSIRDELARVATTAMRALRLTLYSNQIV